MLATLSGEAQVGDILASYPFRLRFAPEVALACLWATSCMPVCQRDTFDLLSCLFEILLSEKERFQIWRIQYSASKTFFRQYPQSNHHANQ